MNSPFMGWVYDVLVWEKTDEFGEPGGEKLYLDRETKGSTALSDLYHSEQQKVRCGSRHFQGALGVDSSSFKQQPNYLAGRKLDRMPASFRRQLLAVCCRLILGHVPFADREVEPLHFRPRVRLGHRQHRREVLPQVGHVHAEVPCRLRAADRI